jgi:Predicted glycosyl hydrolase
MRPLSILLAGAAFLISGCAYHSSVWLAPWDAASTAAVIDNRASITEANPVWYALSADGVITPNWNAENPEVRKAFAGKRLVPTIQNFSNGQWDAGIVARLLTSPQARRAHIDAIVQLVREHHFDGIEIDYEGLPGELRLPFSSFITDLGHAMRRDHRRLAVTVMAKDRADASWAGPAGQDWSVIGGAASSVKIMAYDNHYPGGPAGPLAPLPWLESVARYAKQTIPARKQVFGLPWYGYDWQGTAAKNVTYPQAMALAKATGATVARDENGELHFRYDDHEVWFEDAESYRIKTAWLIQHHPWIGGFAHWRSGSEDPQVWIDVDNLNRHKVR